MPSETKQIVKPMVLPALRGEFGDWTYYSALVPLEQLADRVSFATDIHKNRALSDMIQRSLKGGSGGSRAKDIAQYLRKQKERFFNSLVVAVYGGHPEWFAVKIVKAEVGMPELPDNENTLGALSLSGGEKLFAVDGQHRLAGMKKLILDAPDASKLPATKDNVSVLFIAHRLDNTERTRRLFTTLNKTAVPVSKMERIALDENDAMAIVARRLVEEYAPLKEPRIAMSHTNNLGKDEDTALTTIGNLYDILRRLFQAELEVSRKDLEYNRPSDSELGALTKLSTGYFEKLAGIEPGLREYFNAKDPKSVCIKHRTKTGGSVYFRPLGLTIMTEVVIALKSKGLQWIPKLKKLPRELNQAPFSDTIWTHRNTIDVKQGVLCRNLLLYMCGAAPVSERALRQALREATGRLANLPRKIQ